MRPFCLIYLALEKAEALIAACLSPKRVGMAVALVPGRGLHEVRPIVALRPLGLWMGLAYGSRSAHSYHTLPGERWRQNWTETVPPSCTRTGWRSGM